MTIRKIFQRDEKQIMALLHEYDKYEHKLDKRVKMDSKKELKDFFDKIIKNKFAIGFVAEDDAKIVGLISGIESKNIDGKIGKIHHLIISKKYRQKGLGKKLLKELEKHFKKKGCNTIQSFVFIKNKKVLKFYDKLKYTHNEEGFIIVKKLK